MFASEYGWRMDYILDHVYPDEALLLQRQISRHTVEAQLRNITAAAYPQMEQDQQQEIMSTLERQLTELGGRKRPPEKLDRAGLMALKSELGREKRSRISVK